MEAAVDRHDWPVVLLRRFVTRRKYASAWSAGEIGLLVGVRSA
jgi:hypothetical protein